MIKHTCKLIQQLNHVYGSELIEYNLLNQIWFNIPYANQSISPITETLSLSDVALSCISGLSITLKTLYAITINIIRFINIDRIHPVRFFIPSNSDLSS